MSPWAILLPEQNFRVRRYKYTLVTDKPDEQTLTKETPATVVTDESSVSVTLAPRPEFVDTRPPAGLQTAENFALAIE